MTDKKLNKLTLDSANAVSYNTDTADSYLEENDIDFEKYFNRGLKQIKPDDNHVLSKSQTFFRRVVLAAKITHDLCSEWTFGSVKFQKLVYLCEHASLMNFNTNYLKQAAGPMDNKFIHAVKPEFEKQGWFKVEKVKKGQYEKVQFTPLDGVNGYQTYYSNYYGNVHDEIQHLIDLFRTWKTDDVELVATIYSCWNEIIQSGEPYSEELIVDKVYAFHKKKKKFSVEEITNMTSWMHEQGIYPNSTD